jgi:hypothetical protein
VDGLIVFSNTAEEHAQLLENVILRFDEANLKFHSGKCAIAQPDVHYLGYVFSEKGSRPPLKN